ncbi:porin [Variovorax arabinosiphilus]|uniref:porin n=1 Tax=Variovorax arabinosiphilus TaxID=3053498 RepID=UPI0025776B10|nr:MULTISPECIES: porin [unclassified Variovorax]MDM0118656.1 porin [Variovorax sp. J2L1-78]MDM0129081.1 porin [Variovorax sp. J2L1-63]MDM0233132.1 porin [Variovorax sp. J2R1-6]
MKKILMWSALGLASSGAAHAQSSVTVFGVMDLGIQSTNGVGGGSVKALSNGGLSTSRLGFRGTEDLGGGLQAGFWLEGSLNPDTGTGRASNTNNQTSGAGVAGPLTFDRMSYVSLSHATLGEVRLGRDFIPTHYNSIYFDPFNANGVARAGNLTFAGPGTGPLPTAITGSNTVSYWLPPQLGGFYGMAMVGSGENLSTAANRDDGNFAGARVGFAAGAFDLAAAYTRTHYDTTSTIGNYAHANIGGSWDAGFARFFALYNKVTVRLAAGTVRKNTAEIGAHIPAFEVGRIRVSYAYLDDRSDENLRNANGVPRDRDDARQLGIGYVHILSKRTALYGTYARLMNSGQARYVVSGGVAPAGGARSSGWEFGVRHLF